MGPVLEFWYLLAPAQYPELRKWSMKICSMFGSTYICESTFSTMKHVKSKERNRLSDDNLNHLLRLSTSEIDIDIDMLVKNKDSLQLSHWMTPISKNTQFYVQKINWVSNLKHLIVCCINVVVIIVMIIVTIYSFCIICHVYVSAKKCGPWLHLKKKCGPRSFTSWPSLH